MLYLPILMKVHHISYAIIVLDTFPLNQEVSVIRNGFPKFSRSITQGLERVACLTAKLKGLPFAMFVLIAVIYLRRITMIFQVHSRRVSEGIFYAAPLMDPRTANSVFKFLTNKVQLVNIVKTYIAEINSLCATARQIVLRICCDNADDNMSLGQNDYCAFIGISFHPSPAQILEGNELIELLVQENCARAQVLLLATDFSITCGENLFFMSTKFAIFYQPLTFVAISQFFVGI